LFDLDPAAARETSGWMDTWEDVLRLFDTEQGWRLFPTYVHPMFANAVKAALADRDLSRARRQDWEGAISDGQPKPEPLRQRRIAQELTVDVSRCRSPEQRVVLDYRAFSTLQLLLDLLFVRHLHRVAPAHSYGRKWVLISDRTMLRIAKSTEHYDRALGEADVRPADALTAVLL
jgi:hypothetical protein